ncbi:MAG: glycosyltransferase family 4 protein [Aquificaceae bacterium]
MKVVHFIYDHINNPWVGGGGAVRVYEIYKRLSQKGHSIKVISGKYPGAEDYNVNQNLEYKFVGIPKGYILSTLSYAFYANKALRSMPKDYDLVVEDFAPWNPIFSFLVCKKAILQVHHREGINILKRYSLLGLPFLLVETFYPKLFKNVLTVSGISKEKFRVNAVVIPNGINMPADIPQGPGEYVGFLGRIDIYNKGLDLLLHAVKDLDIKLLIAGKGKDEKKLKEMIKSFKNVEYIGFVERKEDFIKGALFFIMPSRFEGQGIVALEVASYGRPLIVSDIPELRYVVDACFGLSFRKEDHNDLRDKILKLLRDPQLIKDLGKKGVDYAKKFSWDNIAREYEGYLESIAEC